MKQRLLGIFVISILSLGNLCANGLVISVTSVTTSTVTFDISWENSWNINNLSRDAAWVFVKFQDCGSANKSWDHLNLSNNSGDHTVAGTLLQADAVTDGKGVFIRRIDYGGGHNPVTAVTLTFATPFADITDINFNVIGLKWFLCHKAALRWVMLLQVALSEPIPPMCPIQYQAKGLLPPMVLHPIMRGIGIGVPSTRLFRQVSLKVMQHSIA